MRSNQLQLNTADRGSLVYIQSTPPSATCVTNPSGHRLSQASFRCAQPWHLHRRLCSDTVACHKDCHCLLHDPASAAERFCCSLWRSVLQSLVSSLILQQLDYGNTMLAGIPSHLFERMQLVMNSAARLVFSASRYDCITPLLTQLHRLKVPERIMFKLAVLAYRCLHQTALLYLAEEFRLSSAVETRQLLPSAS